jgi:ribosome-associated translation inhibitor RaiA
VAFRTRSFVLTEGIRAHAEKSILNAVGRLGRRIESVAVRLGDVNGPRGGTDKFCRLDAHLVRGDHLHVEDVDRDLYTAMDRAADRLGRLIARAVVRRRDHGTGTPRLSRPARARAPRRASTPVRA